MTTPNETRVAIENLKQKYKTMAEGLNQCLREREALEGLLEKQIHPWMAYVTYSDTDALGESKYYMTEADAIKGAMILVEHWQRHKRRIETISEHEWLGYYDASQTLYQKMTVRLNPDYVAIETPIT